VGEKVDPGVGVEIIAPVGAAVAEGDVVALVHGRRKDEAEEAVRRVGSAFAYGSDTPSPAVRLIEILE
jgi:thymidine phosphorylase